MSSQTAEINDYELLRRAEAFEDVVPDVEMFDDLVMRGGRSNDLVTINTRGDVYIGNGVSRHIPAGIRHLRLGYGESSRSLVFMPATDPSVGGCVSLTRQRGNRGMRFTAKTLLIAHDLLPPEKISLPAVWTGDRIICFYDPEHHFARALKPIVGGMGRTDKTDGTDRTDAVAAKVEEPPVPTAAIPPAAPPTTDYRLPTTDYRIPDTDLAVPCVSFKPNLSKCGRIDARMYNKFVSGVRCCIGYAPATATTVANPPKAPGHAKYGSRPRATCSICGGNLPVSSKGLAKHDSHGVMFTGGRGDPTRVCPGSYTQPKTDN